MKRLTLWGATLLLAAACGSSKGPSGVDSSKYVDQLSASETASLCMFTIASQGGTGAKMCSDGTSVNVPAEMDCESQMIKPHCQVSTVEACFSALGGDGCKLLMTSACAPYIQCALAAQMH
jgi:hypothetical protein